MFTPRVSVNSVVSIFHCIYSFFLILNPKMNEKLLYLPVRLRRLNFRLPKQSIYMIQYFVYVYQSSIELALPLDKSHCSSYRQYEATCYAKKCSFEVRGTRSYVVALFRRVDVRQVHR
jgi:hypothetical protein